MLCVIVLCQHHRSFPSHERWVSLGIQYGRVELPPCMCAMLLHADSVPPPFPLSELTPAAFTAYEGQEVNFTCGITGADVVIWRLNGVAVTSGFASLGLAIPVEVFIDGTLVAAILTVPATLARNGFTIQCIGFLGLTGSSSSNSTLQVQGWSYTPTLVIWSVINF